MTSLGRLIFFDQPGTGVSDPVTPGALPTLEQWADSITAVLDDLGSREAVLLATDGAFATSGAVRGDTSVSHHRAGCARGLRELRYATAKWRDQEADGIPHRVVAMWGDAGVPTCVQSGHAVERGDPGSVGRHERLAASPGTVALMMPLWRIRRAGGASGRPRANPRRPARRRPVHHPARWASTSLITYRARNTLSCPGRNLYHFVEPWRDVLSGDRRIPHRRAGRRGSMIGFSPRCCSPTSWTRRAAPRRWVTVTGMRLLDAHDAVVRSQLRLAFGAAR